jgi:hypothetical protein
MCTISQVVCKTNSNIFREVVSKQYWKLKQYNLSLVNSQFMQSVWLPDWLGSADGAKGNSNAHVNM